MSGMRRVMVVAGEASGDQHAAGLVHEARLTDPQLSFYGVGGQCLRAEGAEILHEARELAVVGISEVFGQLPTILAISRDLKARLRREPPAALLLIDLPDFNLNLAKTARALQIPVAYFISPQIWAWRPGRVRTIAERVTRMIVLFPFEETFYRSHAVPVTFAGHPLSELRIPKQTTTEARQRLGLVPEAPVYGLLPGSRRGEVARHLELMFETARVVLGQQPTAQFVVPVAQTLDTGAIQARASQSGLPVVALAGAFEPLVDACDAALCASGTATLELAARDLPMVVIYRTSALTYLIGKRLVNVEQISLVNLLAGEALVPELIQHQFTPERAASELIALGQPGPRRAKVLAGLARVRAALGPPGAYRRAADALLDLLDEAASARGESQR